MHIYKFRILLEDNDQFFREIDIRANQTFEEFHKAICQSAGFDMSEMASFYICDSKWNKQQELSLCDLSVPEETPIDEDDPKISKKRSLPIGLMCKSRMRDVINDPHQHLIYIYDFFRIYTFYIELFKIREAEEGVEYPLVVKSTGIISKPPTPIATDNEDNDGIEEADELPGSGEEPPQEEGMFGGLYDDTFI